MTKDKKTETSGSISHAYSGNNVVRGIPSSGGMAFGKALVLHREDIVIPTDRINQEDIPKEFERFECAFNALTDEFNELLERVKDESANVGAILETNILVLSDPVLLDSIKSMIEDGISAENSIINEFAKQTSFLKKSKDTILRERAVELDQIKERLLGIMRNQVTDYSLGKNAVIVAHVLTPTDLVKFKEEGILAVVAAIGGITSHCSILARSFELPAVIGVHNICDLVKTGDSLIVDGYNGEVVIDPSNEDVGQYHLLREREYDHKKELGEIVKLPSVTLDGKHVKLSANVDFPKDVETAIINGAEAIGLVRSEHLVISKQYFPSEDMQAEWYNQIAQRAYPRSVTIRAFDVGSDKFSEGLPYHEDNPALGLRGIRFLMKRKDLFNTQIRAILRASKNKNIKFMIPMVSRVCELQNSLKMIEKCKRDLEKADILFDKNLPVGMMVETPASAVLAHSFTDYVDFFSIGTNDLTQYVLAADRSNELVTNVYDSFHPAIMHLIKMTVEAAKKKNIPVSVCGEIAGHAAAAGLLVGLGVDELSVSASILPELKMRIRESTYSDAVKIADHLLQCQSCEEVKQALSIT